MTACGNACCLAILPYKPHLWRICDIVVTCTQWPLFVINSCNCFRVAVGLLVASLTSFLLALSSSLERRPDPGRVCVVPNTFHFLIIDFTVLLGINKAFKMVFVSISWLVPVHNFIPEIFWQCLATHSWLFASVALPRTEMLQESSFHAELIKMTTADHSWKSNGFVCHWEGD